MNLFGITSIIIFFASVGFGLFLYSSNRESQINKAWFAVSIFVGLWGLSLYGVTSTRDIITAERWQYLLDISATLIPVTYFAFVCDLLSIKNNNWFRRFILYLGASISIFSVTPYFKLGVHEKYGFFWVNPGFYYEVFPLFFGGVTIISLTFLIIGYRESNDPLFKAQIRNTLLAGVIGFGGGVTNFFPQIINIYPFGNYFVLLYVFFMSYGVLKYKLLSKKIISAQIVSGAIVLVFLFNLLQPTSLSDWIINLLLFVLVSVFSFLLVRGVYNEINQKEQIEKLIKDVENSNIKLKEANQNQSSLMHFMNHQVKGRLGNAKNIFAELLTDDYGEMPEFARPLLIKGLDEANMGVDYVQNILKGQSAENGTLPYDMKEINAKEVLEKTFSKQKEYAEKKGLKIDLCVKDGEYKMIGDSLELGEAFRNLIDNSINYTPTGSIELTLSNDGNNIMLKIKDTGIGISDDDREKLFKSGGRGADSLKINTNSTGYGLSFVKGVVEAHKGKVWVESEGRGKGSIFYVELPKKI
jgi:signal transduction histidine kinase